MMLGLEILAPSPLVTQSDHCGSQPPERTSCYIVMSRLAGLSQSRRHKMATRDSRLAQFSQGVRKENRPLQILCEDQSGTYIIPYLCEWSEGAWRKVGSAKHIEATVIGWRVVRFR